MSQQNTYKDVLLFLRESLYEDEEFDQHQRQLAALLVSKVKVNCCAAFPFKLVWQFESDF